MVPGWTSKEQWSTARTPPKSLTRSRTSRMGGSSIGLVVLGHSCARHILTTETRLSLSTGLNAVNHAGYRRSTGFECGVAFVHVGRTADLRDGDVLAVCAGTDAAFCAVRVGLPLDGVAVRERLTQNAPVHSSCRFLCPADSSIVGARSMLPVGLWIRRLRLKLLPRANSVFRISWRLMEPCCPSSGPPPVENA